MTLQKSRVSENDLSRREFLQVAGTAVPTLTALFREGAGEDRGDGPTEKRYSSKFTPLDLGPHFNTSPADFGPREQARGMGSPDALIRTPAGRQIFRGIPFQFGPGGARDKTWAMVARASGSSALPSLEIPIAQRVRFVCPVAFCDWDQNEIPPSSAGPEVTEQIGQHLADLVFVYQDGKEREVPLCRRFELDSPAERGGGQNARAFNSLPLLDSEVWKLSDPLPSSHIWGWIQHGFNFAPALSPRDGFPVSMVWISALQNPEPSWPVRALRLQAAGENPVALCALTLFQGREHPLRYERLSLFRLNLLEPAQDIEARWRADIDMGIIARQYVLSDFESEKWLAAPRKGLGEVSPPGQAATHLYLEIMTTRDATLGLRDTKTGKRYEFDLSQLVSGEELQARPAGVRLEVLEREKVLLHGQVLEASTGRPTPVRISFRSKQGRYIPPAGHRVEVNEDWFQDYGADLKLGETSFAYVDGTFQVELPVGEVYAEITKGFEYAPVRQKLEIKPEQRDLKLEISRFIDLRSQGWVTADVHVHFLSPSTAILEGQAEGVNLVNLLAAQWGDFFSNIGDLPHPPLVSQDRETIVWVGTENRQHLLGHINLLGGRGEPVYPLSAGGPEASHIGDPVWTSLSEWADACHKREGVVVLPHFPWPLGEMAADIALGKVDALEIYPSGLPDPFNKQNYLEWYRYLNCGYHLPIVAGTDKMGAFTPIGYNRTYAHIGQEEFSFPAWAQAVRKGNTFATTGPLLFFQVDGHVPGEEITLGAGGGTVEISVEAKCFIPLHRVEVMMNGKVIAMKEESAGSHELLLREKLQVSGAAWLAARCYSREKPLPLLSQAIAAHTSPVYVHVSGQDLFSPKAAAYFLKLIEGSQTWLENLAIRPSAERLEGIQRVLAEAHKKLHHRLDQHHHHC